MLPKANTLAALAGLGMLALTTVPNVSAAPISCPDVELPTNNVNHFYSIDTEEGSCTKVSGESEHPENGYNVYHYFYEYNGFTITETRGTFYRNGEIDKAGVFKVGCQKDSCTQTIAFKDGAGLDQRLVMVQSYSGRWVKNISAVLQADSASDKIWASCTPASDTDSRETYIAHQVFDFSAGKCWASSNFGETFTRPALSHDFRVLLNATPTAAETSWLVMYWGTEFSNIIVNGEDVSGSPNRTLKIDTDFSDFRSYVVQFDRGGKTYQTTFNIAGGSNTLQATALFERAIYK